MTNMALGITRKSCKLYDMEVLRVEILNPKAKKLLKGLEELELINVQPEPKDKFKAYLRQMRSKSKNAPSLQEITKIVDQVRSERYGKKKER
jgi:hypothetical protein